ncbi:MAG TPA: hypothetical protein VMP08_05375 [Anaerolineae bacterium]|nr:hypothetical protein [Anaerolineae bacterium]
MKKLIPIVVVIMIAALVLSACGGGAAPSGGAQSAPTETAKQPAAKPTEKPAEIPTEKPAANPSDNATPEALDLANVSAGLNELNSYKASFTMNFAGVDSNSKPTTGTLAYTEEFVKDPPAKRTIITGLGGMLGSDSTPTPDQNSGVLESIEVGGKQYSKMGDICSQITADSGPQANTMMDPNSIIGGVRGAQLIGTETVNGVPTAHYKIDSTGLDVLGYINSSGDVWVATPGNYVVKYTFQATSTGKEAFFGSAQGQQGTVMWDYEVTDINQPIDIQAPANCGGAAEDIPMMTDAQDQAAFGGTSTYSTPSKFEDVVAFYDKEMKAKGWTEGEGGMSTEAMAMKSYTKDGRTVQVVITSDASSGKTQVMITEQKQ